MCRMMPDSFLKTDKMEANDEKKLKDLYDSFRGPPEQSR